MTCSGVSVAPGIVQLIINYYVNMEGIEGQSGLNREIYKRAAKIETSRGIQIHNRESYL